MLDELRAVSAALQSLPQEKLGEDISPQVLRVAERRMLTEDEPGDEAAVPLSRAFFQRFINRRSLIWLGLTAAVAVMIVLHEQQQNAPPANTNHRRVAAKLDESDKAATNAMEKPLPPATIQAAHEANASRLSQQRAARSLAPVVEDRTAKVKQDLQRSASATRPAKGMETWKFGDKAEVAGSPPSEKAYNLGTLAAPARVLPPGSTPPPPPGDQEKLAAAVGKAAGFGGMSGPSSLRNWYDADGVAAIRPDVLLVFCNVTPAATKEKAFDRVLLQNGIASRRHVEYGGQHPKQGEALGFADEAKAVPEEKPPKYLPAGNVVRREAVAGNVELVYVEAAPEQVRATLDGLAAQPKLFVSVSVKSPQDKASQEFFLRYAKPHEALTMKSVLAAGAYKQEGQLQIARERESPAMVPAKPAEVAAVDHAVTALPKGDASSAGGRNDKEIETSGRQPAKSEGGGSQQPNRNFAGQSPNAAASPNRPLKKGATTGLSSGAAGNTRENTAGQASSGTQTTANGPLQPAAKRESSVAMGRDYAPAAATKSQTRGGIQAQRIVPAQQQRVAAEGEGIQRHGRDLAPRSGGQAAPRQKVLFVLRLDNGPPPVALQAGGSAGDRAKVAPSPPPATPAAPAPSK